MRAPTDRTKIERFLEALGRHSRGEGTVYLTGGASALLVGWRAMTADIDIKLDPEPAGAFEAIARLKDELDVNVELAAPDQFIPPLPGWREHSAHVGRFGKVEVFHYDFRAQALSKLARGSDRDVADVEAMVRRGLVTPPKIEEAFEAIRTELIRYPRLNAHVLAERIRELGATRE